MADARKNQGAGSRAAINQQVSIPAGLYPMRRQNIVLESIEPRAFMASASFECMTELRLARLAVEQSNNEFVRKFADNLVGDYEKMLADIARVAARRTLPVPTCLDELHDKIVERMRERAGPEFDLAYTDRMVEGHQHAIMLFRRGQQIKDPEISAMASRGLTMLDVLIRRASALLESTVAREPPAAKNQGIANIGM